MPGSFPPLLQSGCSGSPVVSTLLAGQDTRAPLPFPRQLPRSLPQSPISPLSSLPACSLASPAGSSGPLVRMLHPTSAPPVRPPPSARSAPRLSLPPSPPLPLASSNSALLDLPDSSVPHMTPDPLPDPSPLSCLESPPPAPRSSPAPCSPHHILSPYRSTPRSPAASHVRPASISPSLSAAGRLQSLPARSSGALSVASFSLCRTALCYTQAFRKALPPPHSGRE